MSQTQEKAGKLKVKAKILKPKNLSRNDEPIKIDLSKNENNFSIKTDLKKVKIKIKRNRSSVLAENLFKKWLMKNSFDIKKVMIIFNFR